ncbi:hypothetical protein [Flavobacterium sharifuzzamanii]|uniref:hypothetical protein n=1 Tax=Flavobacterium sharifuzzamanii TaxID=2211133 RepID=UPI0013A57B72|nr:hypothetical protein [Flavobacterium sharifuzzamanii]KAF2078707.1 hypothetical protein DMA14_19630 [Flavobacterium sharifuzzamanii]
MKKNRDSYPQYISSEMFANALIDIIGSQSEITQFTNVFQSNDSKNLIKVEMEEFRFQDPYERFQKGLDAMEYSPFKSYLRGFFEKTENYSDLKNAISKWFDDYMERVSGWYKIRTKRSIFIISLLVCFALNVDSITLIKKLNTDDKYRKDLVLLAEKKVLENKFNDQKIDSVDLAKNLNSIKSIINEIEDNSLPIGYQDDFKELNKKNHYIMWFVGILISAFALSFGAPFWFEVMVKAINIRRAGIKPS